MNEVRHQRQTISLLLVGIVCVFGLSHAFSAQAMIVQNKSFVSEATIGSAIPSISFGSIDSLYNSLMSKFKNKNMQQVGIVCRRSSKQDEVVGKNKAAGSDKLYKGHLKKICTMIFIMFFNLPCGMLFGSHHRSLEMTERTSDIHVNQPLGESIEEFGSCCAIVPRNIRALPIIYGTNVAGNLLAIGVAYYAPAVPVASVAAGAIGCVGGCLEAYSIDHTCFTANQHALHNNFFTGYVADQVTGSCGSCCMFPIVNAAAIGAPVGYGCGLGTGLAMRYGLARLSSTADSTIVSSQEQMER